MRLDTTATPQTIIDAVPGVQRRETIAGNASGASPAEITSYSHRVLIRL